VFFGEAQTQDIFHNTLETNSGKPGEPGSKFRVKKGDGVHPGFAKTGKVLVGRVNNPFEMGELMRNVIECPHTHRVNQEVRCSRSVGLHEVCPGGIAKATGPFRVECEGSRSLH
jgi:hypothetical protein